MNFKNELDKPLFVHRVTRQFVTARQAMNPQVRRVLGESVETPTSKDTPIQVIETTKPIPIHVCPHCQKEIYEKHTYTDGDPLGEHIERHSDCGGAIKWPPPDAETQKFLDQLKQGNWPFKG